MKNNLFRLANKLYEHFYPIYQPLYALWKALSDRRERKLLSQIIQPGMTVVDVGANIGIYTRFFSELVADSGHVYSFEPAPQNYKHLKDNLAHLTNVSFSEAAVGNEDGVITLFISDELNVDHHTFDCGDGRTQINVPIVSLDKHLNIGQRVDLIKIDVQGFELSVLEGAQRILKENANIKVMMEFWPYGLTKAGVSPTQVIDLLNNLGFEIRTTGSPHGDLFDGSSLDRRNINHYCNLIISR